MQNEEASATTEEEVIVFLGDGEVEALLCLGGNVSVG